MPVPHTEFADNLNRGSIGNAAGARAPGQTAPAGRVVLGWLAGNLSDAAGCELGPDWGVTAGLGVGATVGTIGDMDASTTSNVRQLPTITPARSHKTARTGTSG